MSINAGPKRSFLLYMRPCVVIDVVGTCYIQVMYPG